MRTTTIWTDRTLPDPSRESDDSQAQRAESHRKTTQRFAGSGRAAHFFGFSRPVAASVLAIKSAAETPSTSDTFSKTTMFGL